MKKYALVVPTIFLVVLFLKLLSNYAVRFDEVEKNYSMEPECAINLEKGTSAEGLANILVKNNYISNNVDAEFVSNFIIQKLDSGETLSALYDFTKSNWQIPVSLIDSIGTEEYKGKARDLQKLIGIDEIQGIEISQLTSSVNVNGGKNGVIYVSVSEKIENSKATKPCANVIVRLSEQDIDSLDNFSSKRETLSFVKTDENGQAVFRGLDPNLSYSVLPIKKGFEYGTTKGTIGGNLAHYENSELSCSFIQQEQKVKIFTPLTLKQIKEDQTITIRSPKEFKNILTKYVVLFFIVWWGLWLLCLVRKKSLNNTILSILMALSGLCMLTMFSLNDPLTDRLIGVDMAQGIIIGVVIIGILLNVNFKRFYQNQCLLDFDFPIECIKWIFKPFKTKVSYLTRILSNRSRGVFVKCVALLVIVVCLPMLIFDLLRITLLNNIVSKSLDRLPKGFGYMLTAICLTMLLFTPLGVAVGGMKVNLNIGILFQPSEIAKYLIVFFMAAYFCVNANKIVQFSEDGNAGLFGAKLRMLMSILIGLGVLMGLYLVLGDMGPALVLAFTFIILYSIIKSKVDLDGVGFKTQLKRIFTCDIAMLIYGVISFVAFLLVGNILGNMGIFCLAWFIVWIVFNIVKRRVYETPIFFNLIIAIFIFGDYIGDVAGFDSVAERLNSRTEMCTNTWGTLPLDGNAPDAGENTQVAEGLWGLASGGLYGQGLGNGSPHFIPAFHTDMILESIGEQMGFVGIFVIILLIALLLRKTIVLGYRTSHPFTFYLSMGIAIVTAIQFIIISLGSVGVIPLTGVTVPFLSFGKVSMILNLAAYGIILSIASHTSSETLPSNATVAKLANKNIRKYNYSVSLLSWIYCVIAIIICGAYFYYQIVDRDNILIKPVYVNNSNGFPILEYNPRINQLTEKMYSGDIYDRNGVLLATSDKSKLREFEKIYCDTLKKQKRYYPFGEHLFFMLGDLNTELYLGADAESKFPRGYMAESVHLSDLKGYDNRKKDIKGNPVKVNLESSEFAPDKFHSNKYKISYEGIQIRDYSALLPYLKAGLHSDKVKRLNERKSGDIEPKDVQLTIDAKLQIDLQNEMKEWIPERYKDSRWLNRIRASVVIVDAENGDLLASANYPLFDSNREEIKRDSSYRDNKVPRGWTSYTDMDLGLIYPTAPGSTAKIMSSLAALRKCGVEAADKNNNKYRYRVYQSQLVGAEWAGDINMFEAVWRSSNCYFINLVNDYNLYPDLYKVYRAVGAQLGYNKSYGLLYADSTMIKSFSLNDYPIDEAVAKYRKYKEDDRRDKMDDAIWQWAWGQGDLRATPLTMARVASIVANDGKMRPTRFCMNDTIENEIQIVSESEADALGEAMIYEAKNHIISINLGNDTVGGKTGTANRHLTDKKGNRIQRSNDAWYICYIKPSNKEKKSLAVAVRIERGQSSANAKSLVKMIVLEKLANYGYIDKDI